MSTARGVAKSGEAVELLRHRDEGPQIVSVELLDDVPVVVGLSKRREGSESSVASDLDTRFKGADSGYQRDGSTTTFSGESLQAPVVPGSVSVEATDDAAAVTDPLKNGVLYINAQARKRASGGSFATMASESMVVKLQDGAEQTITFGTEATIGAAVDTINDQLKGGSAVAQGAEDVDLLSDLVGVQVPPTRGGIISGSPVISSVEVVSVDAGITTKLGITAGVSDVESGSIDYFTGALELDYPGGYVPSTGEGGVASVLGTTTAPFNMSPGDTLVVDTDGGGDETATFDAGPAVATGAGGTFAAMNNETMDVQVNGGEVQTVTFGTEATIELAVQLMNEQITGAFADQVDANNARITSDGAGTAQEIILSNVDAGITTKLGLSNGTDNGTGDVADINAVTAAEVKTVVEADTTGLTVTSVGGKIRLSAATSVNVNATSDLEGILGLSTALATATSGGSSELEVDYISSQQLAGLSRNLLKVPNLSEIEELVIEAAASGGRCAVQVKAEKLRI